MVIKYRLYIFVLSQDYKEHYRLYDIITENHMKRLLLIILIISLPSCYFISCKKDKGDPPLLPPYESMVIDFSNFTSQKKSYDAAARGKGTESSTWEFAASVAGEWNTLISSYIEVPLAAFEAAINFKPEYVSENLWEWSYDFSQGLNAYKANLQGKISTNSDSWKMYITFEGTGGYNEFLWIEGSSKTDGSGGQWIFKESVQSPAPLFQTDWTKSGDEVTSVKYTYLKNDTNKDSFINYLIFPGGSFDASYNIHFSNGLYSDSDIEWNITTRDGRLKCIDYSQDENWYCWDTNKLNKECD
jgi:hypothetical protein